MTDGPPTSASGARGWGERWRRFARSFYFAARGVCRLVRTEQNAQVHAVATVVVVTAGLWLGLSSEEWSIISLAIAMVWAAEGLNSAIETLADEVTLEQRPLIERAKDLAAGAVLLAAMGAAAAGAFIFLPKLLR